MITYVSPITEISLPEIDNFSLKIAELEELLAAITESCTLEHRPAMMISVAERLANWLQADIQALHTAYRNQHGGYLDKPEKPVQQKLTPRQQAVQADAETLHDMLQEMHERYTDNQAIDDLFIQAVAIAGSIRANTEGDVQ